MKVIIGTALFVLLAGSTTFAQEQDKDKPAQKEEKKQEPAAKENKAAREQPKAQPQEHPEAQQRQAQQHQEQQKDQAKQTEKEKSGAEKQQQQTAKQQQQQQVARQEHTNGQQAQRDGGNRNERRINEQEFHQHFGREHEFRVTRSEDRRFNYGGYYWVYNDPWPTDWAYTDEVYVDEIDGEYYLIDPVHPGLRLLVVIAD
jgi:flagellar motor protein MotB